MLARATVRILSEATAIDKQEEDCTEKAFSKFEDLIARSVRDPKFQPAAMLAAALVILFTDLKGLATFGVAALGLCCTAFVYTSNRFSCPFPTLLLGYTALLCMSTFVRSPAALVADVAILDYSWMSCFGAGFLMTVAATIIALQPAVLLSLTWKLLFAAFVTLLRSLGYAVAYIRTGDDRVARVLCLWVEIPFALSFFVALITIRYSPRERG